jgi:branched-chain amino acid transport system substrate-binding protein
MQPKVKAGKRYAFEDGEIEIDSIKQITFDDITPKLARECGFASVPDMLKVAKHGRGENVYLVKFHFIALLLSFLLVLPLFAQKRRAAESSPGTIRIGALFSLTGDGSTLGNASAAALDIAATDINAEMQTMRLPYRVVTFTEDTAHVPANALAKLIELNANNVGYVIGPQSSAEAAAVRDYANTNNIIVVSQGSTASSLALPNDTLFRLAPNDKLEGAAIAALMRADGIDTIVEVSRDDAGNVGLRDSTMNSFVAAGGTVANVITYTSTTTNFAPVVTFLGTVVRGIENSKPNAKIAVYLSAFDEAADIFDFARLDADLSSIRWYGGDGVVQSQALLARPTVASFAATTQFTAPNVGLDDATRDVWQPVSDQIKARVGFTPDAYALSVYDAAWVIALSFIESQGAGDLRKTAFTRSLQRYSGLTGSTAVDANGDRKSGNFDFWTIRDGQWIRTGQYVDGHISR